VYTATVKSISNVASTNFFFFLCRLKSNHPTMLPYFHSQSHPTRPVSYICDTELGIHCAFQCSRMQQVCLSVCLSSVSTPVTVANQTAEQCSRYAPCDSTSLISTDAHLQRAVITYADADTTCAGRLWGPRVNSHSHIN
jgi:hypothetical protein